ncbi:MAG: helix-turn-helix transcriptional regulator [Christensenellaceae bacterium]|nr:helix-turn-helix transcriptional regulator [Christensenellaceae bacterium]
MLCEKIKELRENAGYSQSQLAKRLDVTRSSVNAWEMGLSMPTTQYVVALSKLFHVSTDYLLGLEKSKTLVLDGYNENEIELIYNLINYIDSTKK